MILNSMLLAQRLLHNITRHCICVMRPQKTNHGMMGAEFEHELSHGYIPRAYGIEARR